MVLLSLCRAIARRPRSTRRLYSSEAVDPHQLSKMLFQPKLWQFTRAFDTMRPMRQLDPMPEIAVVGRSNCGKSTLINAMTLSPGLAQASRTPGRTQKLNVFESRPTPSICMRIVDLPGYGYTAAGMEAGIEWSKMIRNYIFEAKRGRVQLVLLLLDARRGITETDRMMIEFLESKDLRYQVALTKCDKLSDIQVNALIMAHRLTLGTRPLCMSADIATSSKKKRGIDDLRLAVVETAFFGTATKKELKTQDYQKAIHMAESA